MCSLCPVSHEKCQKLNSLEFKSYLMQILTSVNPDSSQINKIFRKLAESASWWSQFGANTDAREIHDIVSQLQPLELASVDRRARSMTSYAYYCYGEQNWRSLQPSEVKRLAHLEFAPSLLGLASFHYSGYVRGAAVLELASLETGKELPYLLIRLNDWVPEVRQAATQAVAARMKPEYAGHFLHSISLVFQLRNGGRVDKQFIDGICSLLKRPENWEILQQGMSAKDQAIRRISFQLAFETEPGVSTSILRMAMADPDAVTRCQAVWHGLSQVNMEDLPEVLRPMLSDRYMPIRREALCCLAQKRPELAKEPLRAALLDKHAAMREAARHFLAIADIGDVRDFYAQTLQREDKKHIFASICGLGETGSKSDVNLIIPFVGATLSRLRRAAVYAIAKLDFGEHLTTFVKCVADEKPSVSQEAYKALLKEPSAIPLEQLEQMFKDDVNLHVRRNALGLIIHMGKWRRLPTILMACVDANAQIAEMGTAALHKWISSSGRQSEAATRSDFERIQSALVSAEHRLPKNVAKLLRWQLKLDFQELG